MSLFFLLPTSSPLTPCSRSPDPNDPESHKNEGFLKNLWHNLTNHPAHQEKPSGESSDSTTAKKPDDKASGDDDAKKPGSGSS